MRRRTLWTPTEPTKSMWKRTMQKPIMRKKTKMTKHWIQVTSLSFLPCLLLLPPLLNMATMRKGKKKTLHQLGTASSRMMKLKLKLKLKRMMKIQMKMRTMVKTLSHQRHRLLRAMMKITLQIEKSKLTMTMRRNAKIHAEYLRSAVVVEL